MKRNTILKKTLACISLMALLLTGCAKVPEAITEKTNTERLEEKAVVTLAAAPAEKTQESQEPQEPPMHSSPLYEKLGAPTRYTAVLNPISDIVTITVDAPVYLPDIDKLPTLHVSPRDFTEQEVMQLFSALCGDTVMYKARQQMTRQEIMERIEDVQTEMETATDKDRIKKLESNLTYWQEAYENAPETLEQEVSQGQLEERQLGLKEYLGKYMALDAYEQQTDYYTHTGKSFHVHGQTFDKNLKSSYDFPISGSIWYDRDDSFGQYLNYNQRTWIADETLVPADARGLAMTPLQARQLVESFWKDSGFSDMAVVAVYLTQNTDTGLSGGTDTPDAYGDNSAYVVACGRSIHGILPPPPSGGDPHWAFESCTFTITDRGIETFIWNSPYAYGDETTEDSSLLSFAAIDEIFQKMMTVKYDETGDAGTLTSAAYHIDRVALEMSRLTNRKSSEKGLLIPVWNFYGSYYFTYSDGHAFGSEDREGFPQPLLRINAIDGTLIEPRYGC